MYFAVFAKSLKQQLMYRSEFLLRIIGNLFYIYIQICIWRALLDNSSAASPVTAAQMVTYVIVAYLLRQMSRTRFVGAFYRKVSYGDIAVDLIRPVSMKNMMIAEQLSENFCVIVFSCLPVAVVSGLLWGIEFSASATHMLLFVPSVFMAIALSLYLEYVTGLFVFWTRSDVYTHQIFWGLYAIFSGAAIPLWFYPEWLAQIARFLPFRLMAFEPIRIFMGRVDLAQAAQILLQQILWLAAIYLVERMIWLKLRHNIFVQGG